MHATDIFLFADSFGIGQCESVLIACGKKGFVARRMHSRTAGDYYIYWV
jgi:hypothetical protein